jgi:hypothetical protein
MPAGVGLDRRDDRIWPIDIEQDDITTVPGGAQRACVTDTAHPRGTDDQDDSTRS